MKTKVVSIVALLVFAAGANAALVGLWEFDNASNLAEATIGTDLTWTGSPTASAGVTGGDGAAFSPKGTYLTADNPIGGNGTGARTNEYTILIDFKLPTINGWNPIFSTANGGGTGQDADYWVSTSRGLGVSSEGYVDDNDPPLSIDTDTWHRLVVYVDQGTLRSTYVDGAYLGNHYAGSVDGRWSMQSTFSVFADNTSSERSDYHVTNVALFDALLTSDEIESMGGAGETIIPEPMTLSLLALGGLAVIRRKRK